LCDFWKVFLIFLFLDYGNSDLLVLSDICHLPEKFASQPQYCYRTKFNCIDNELEASYKVLTEYLLNESSKFKVVSYSEGHYYIELFDSDSCFNCKIDPNYKLVKNEIASKENLIQPDTTEKTLEIGSVHEFIVSFLGDQELFFNLKSEHTQLLKLQDDINTSEVKAALKIHSKPQIGDLVLAKFYEEDRLAYNWYRGQIQDINGEKIKVFYLGKKFELVFF